MSDQASGPTGIGGVYSAALSPAAAAKHAMANAELEGLAIPDGLEQVLFDVAAGDLDADAAIAGLLAQPLP